MFGLCSWILPGAKRLNFGFFLKVSGKYVFIYGNIKRFLVPTGEGDFIAFFGISPGR
jgi:hypothetical protein